VREAWGDAASMRALASRMGHELGQMRLGFDPRGYRVQPGYRDDHACLWDTPEEQARELCLPAGASQAPPAPDSPEPPGPPGDAARRESPERGTGPSGARSQVACTLPEWDWRIRRHRPGWCTVREQRAVAPTGAQAPEAPWVAYPPVCVAAAEALLRGWERRTRPVRARAQLEGEHVEPRAMLDWLSSRAAGAPAEPRLFRGKAQARVGGHLLVLLDCSASSDAGPGGAERFARARGTALALLLAARARGWNCALAGFSSDTRHHLRVLRVQDFGERPPPAELAERLRGLRAQWSTRLGAALRYGAWRLRRTSSRGPRRLLLISDGQARDVDVHDPRYLRADLRQARRELAAAEIALQQHWPGYVK
jgi:Mg-chelatase subunit ChlD